MGSGALKNLIPNVWTWGGPQLEIFWRCAALKIPPIFERLYTGFEIR
jgi:hypothetical protein